MDTFCLDISKFLGDVCVVGFRGDTVRKDPVRHVTVKASWRSELDWNALGIGPFSYWKIWVKKLAVFGAEEGVFSLPKTSDKHYGEAIKEKAILEQAGIGVN